MDISRGYAHVSNDQLSEEVDSGDGEQPNPSDLVAEHIDSNWAEWYNDAGWASEMEPPVLVDEGEIPWPVACGPHRPARAMTELFGSTLLHLGSTLTNCHMLVETEAHLAETEVRTKAYTHPDV